MNQVYHFYSFLAFLIIPSTLFHLVLPFPFYVIVPLLIFVVLPLMFRSTILKKFNLNQSSNSKVKFVCVTCGMNHDLDQCPRCGSKMKKGEF